MRIDDDDDNDDDDDDEWWLRVGNVGGDLSVRAVVDRHVALSQRRWLLVSRLYTGRRRPAQATATPAVTCRQTSREKYDPAVLWRIC